MSGEDTGLGWLLLDIQIIWPDLTLLAAGIIFTLTVMTHVERASCYISISDDKLANQHHHVYYIKVQLWLCAHSRPFMLCAYDSCIFETIVCGIRCVEAQLRYKTTPSLS
jgi:hypothetical protein